MTKSRTMLVILGMLGSSTAAAAEHSGATQWGPWRFDWQVKDSAGLALRNVHYQGEQVIYKASMPVIRVQYDDDECGPFADMIAWENMLEISSCDDRKVCQRSFSYDGQEWLEVGVLAQIGEYGIYQVWYLSDDGQLTPRMWSSGMQCDVSHNHHAYWRLDLDVAGAEGDRVFVYDRGAPNEGWGPGWHQYTGELNDRKDSATDRRWFVRDDGTGRGMWILPGPDGVADRFSTKDVGVRLYHHQEDAAWRFGARGHLGYDDRERVDGRDIVFWYVAHLRHLVSQGPTDWHWVGPYLRVAAG
jgi:hypothetical protein